MDVLKDAGFRVKVPKQRLCCERPLYDFGMLDGAKKYLREILTALEPEIAAGIPIGKMALYTAISGIHPEHCLPVLLALPYGKELWRCIKAQRELYYDGRAV